MRLRNVQRRCRPKKYQPGPKRKLVPYEQEIRQLVAKHPDATLVELHAMLPNNIDETWTKTNMIPCYGQSEKGKRLIDYTPFGHWKTTTLVGALRYDGLTAQMVIDGAVHGNLFLAYVKQILLPTFHAGDIVVLDNLSSYKRAEVSEMIQSVDARVLYLPPYSPDFNPIEMVFSKLKQLVCKFKLRKMDELWHKLGDVFSPKECQNYFRHAGYGKKS